MKLDEWRRSKGLTQQDIADALGCVVPTVARYEAGSRKPESPPVAGDRDMMTRIFILTGGDVRPNDFYPLEDWEAELIEREARAELERRAA